MFKSKSSNVKKASEKNETTSSTSNSGTMTLKKKDKIKSVSNKESPEYRKKTTPKKSPQTPSKNWVENKTYKATNTKKKKK